MSLLYGGAKIIVLTPIALVSIYIVGLMIMSIGIFTWYINWGIKDRTDITESYQDFLDRKRREQAQEKID